MDDIEEIRRQHAKAEAQVREIAVRFKKMTNTDLKPKIAQFLEVLDRWGIPKYIDPDGQVDFKRLLQTNL
eukprot:818887-Amorphochlora_amoeboformis.AAC.3